MSTQKEFNDDAIRELMSIMADGKMHCSRCGRITTEGRIETEMRDGDEPNEKWLHAWIVCPECNRKELAWDYD